MTCDTLPPQLHKQADMQEEKNRIERVLGAISAPDLIQKVLTFALSVRMSTLVLVELYQRLRSAS